MLANGAARGEGQEVEASLSTEFVERLVDERYGMTRHALAEHAPEGAIFAVSSFGPGASGNRPPAELRPLGLEGPLGWVAQQLEARDRADMNRLWELAPATCPGSSGASSAYERRYPRSNRSYEFRGRIKKLVRKRRCGAGLMRGVAAGLLALAVLAGSDLLAFYRASSFERAGDSAAPPVARRWSELLELAPVAADCSGRPWPGGPD